MAQSRRDSKAQQAGSEPPAEPTPEREAYGKAAVSLETSNDRRKEEPPQEDEAENPRLADIEDVEADLVEEILATDNHEKQETETTDKPGAHDKITIGAIPDRLTRQPTILTRTTPGGSPR
jgi:hypothetical protein